MMIYLKLNGSDIEFTHFKPFDKVDGLGKTEEELLSDGILVDSIPEPEPIEGKAPVLKYDGTNLYYEYVDAPLTPEEQTKQEIESLKAQNAQMLLVLVEGGLM